MLEELHIRDLALIEDAWMEFSPGMTVLTGETGAGKTALLGGVKLLLGERADSGSVRSGSTEAVVEGRFLIDGTETIVRRKVGSDGRSRCTIDSEMVPVGALTQRVGPTVDLHGQHDHQALLAASTHVEYLDRWAGEPVRLASERYRLDRERWLHTAAELELTEARMAQAARDADYLAFLVAEIERVDPSAGEDELLRSRLPVLQHSQRLAEAAASAAHVLRGESGALDAIATARDGLQRVAGIDDELDTLAAQLNELEVLIDDVGVSVRAYRDRINHDPASLDATQARLSELSGLCKKYGPTLDAVLERLQEARESLAVVHDGEALRDEMRARLASDEAALRSSAAVLDAARRDAAPRFTDALGSACSELAMDGASFEVAFTELAFDAWTGGGPSRIEFLYSPAPGQPYRHLARIASGGEISRVMLALKGVLGAADTVDTLVFDEIDAGIGGATAMAVGARLARLAQTHQVIVVTHLAQVAAFAQSHLVVVKTAEGESVSTRVERVTGVDRVREISRMLSGDDSDAGAAHARELLERAGEAVTAR